MINHTRSEKPCEHCGTYEIYNHAVECPTVPLEEKVKLYQAICEEYRQSHKRMAEYRARQFERLHNQATLWQGKYLIVKRENNALRKMLNKRESK